MLQNMFLVENNVPDVYVNESRDFQLIARLYNLALQSTRFSIDSMDYISDTSKCNNTLLPLIGTKVGFFSSQKLSDETLRKILSAFPFIIRHKGSKEGIQLVLNLFERITNTKVALQETSDPSEVIIRFSTYMINVELLYELLEYVRPAGMIIKVEFITDVNYSSDYLFKDSVDIRETIRYTDLTENDNGVTTLSGVVVKDIVINDKDSDAASNIGFTVIAKTGEEKDKDSKEGVTEL